MGCLEPFAEDAPFEDKVKCLADDDLLEVWVESQGLSSLLDCRFSGHEWLADNYERVIVRELTLRANQKLARH